jgi:FkbM family methyltransferase
VSDRTAEVTVDNLLSERRVESFSSLLAAYRAAGHDLDSAIDGGAGAGWTAKSMLRHLDGEVYAFEPFPGNRRFFAGLDSRIRLIPKALAERPGRRSFRVAQIVAPDSAWGRRGMAGYSSSGRLVGGDEQADHVVECVRADDEIDDEVRIDFIKLDLQGGELGALRGMPRLLSEARLLWVEYKGNPGLLDFLATNGFTLFETEYTFWGKPSDAAVEHFDVALPRRTASNGNTVWKGFRRTPWASYEADFRRLRKEISLVQTDLVCVRDERLDEFRHALRSLA